MQKVVALVILAMLSWVPATLAEQDSDDGTTGRRFVMIVSGIGGEEKYEELHWNWAVGIHEAVRTNHGIPGEQIYLLVSDPTVDPALSARKSSLTNIEQTIDEIGDAVTPSDMVFIILIGHGSASGSGAKVNIPGPDLSADRLASLLNNIDAGNIVIINGASSSGPFIAALSAENRVVITATKSGGERNATVFHDHFLSGLSVENSDLDKDGRVSLMEVFTYTRLKTAEWYEDQGRIATEHPLLDDNGDGNGSRDPGGDDLDGALARSINFGGSRREMADYADLSSEDRAKLTHLQSQSSEIQGQIDDLNTARDTMESSEYDERIEALLIKLAKANRDLKRLASP